MESSIKAEKIQGLKKKNNRAQIFVYNIILYSLTSCITCLFFTYTLWYSSMKQLVFSLPNNITLFFNPKFFFILVNIIVLILVGESKRTGSSRPSPATEIYNEYIARSRRYAKANSKIPAKAKVDDETLIPSLNHVKTRNIVQENMHTSEEKIKRSNVSKCTHRNLEEKKTGMRTSKSEVWSKSEIVEVKENDPKFIPCLKVEEKKIVEVNKHDHHHHEENKKELSVIKSMMHHQDEEKKNGMRKCKSEVWGESEIMKRKKSDERKEDKISMQKEELNKRVEAFIARINKQRLLETKSVDLSEG